MRLLPLPPLRPSRPAPPDNSSGGFTVKEIESAVEQILNILSVVYPSALFPYSPSYAALRILTARPLGSAASLCTLKRPPTCLRYAPVASRGGELLIQARSVTSLPPAVETPCALTTLLRLRYVNALSYVSYNSSLVPVGKQSQHCVNSGTIAFESYKYTRPPPDIRFDHSLLSSAMDLRIFPAMSLHRQR